MTPAQITTAIAEGLVLIVPVSAAKESLIAQASPIDSMAYAAHVAEMAADARRYRAIRDAGKSLKLYAYDDPEDYMSGEWRYDPSPEDVDSFADSAIASKGGQ